MVSLASLIVFSPVLLLAALAIKLSDGGPVVFRQKRLSRFNHAVGIFTNLEVINWPIMASAQSKPFAKMGRPELAVEYRKTLILCRAATRISRVGRWLPRHKLDELPQLLNVLKGDIA